MTKAQETRARRAAALAILGAGWRASAGIEGARDMYTRRVNGREIMVLPQRTVDGNFYIGLYSRTSKKMGFADTLEQAAALANEWAS